MKTYKQSTALVSFVSSILAVLLTPTAAQADINDPVGHAKDDTYWADLAQDYPPFIAPRLAARTAARNEDINGQWGSVIPWPHIPVSAANLPDGRILSYSASGTTAFPGGREYSYSSTWDPASNTFLETPNTGHDMFCAHLSTLEDGRIFVTGGRNHVKTTSTFDFATNTWTQSDNMNNGRWYPTTLTMPTGSVFTAIGSSGGQYPELWTEGSGWTSLTGASLQTAIISLSSNYEHIWWPLLHVDPKGKVFHSGPTPKMHSIDTSGLGKVTQVGPEMNEWYPKHGATVMFDEGKLLVAGGATAGNNQKSTNKAMIIDINGPSPIVTPVDPMANARKFQNATMLPTGEVLMIGGNSSGIKFNDSGTILAPEIWNPTTKKWRSLAAMQKPRNYHSIALLMADGRVLAAGGGLCGGCAANHQDGEVFSPPYLFNNDGTLATRPTISNAPDTIKYGQNFTLQSTGDITKFSMVKMSATTHSVNTDLRYLEVPFQQAGAGLYELTSHANINVLTPGNWMLFAVNSAGVPSVAKVINVSSSGLPRITQPRDQVNVVGDSITYSIIATDADNDPLNYQASGLPLGLSINTSNGLITGTATQKGTFKPTITVTDGESSVSVTFNWSIFPGGSVPGISYEYFEGDWNTLPDFSALTPVATGTTDTFNTDMRNRDDYYGLRFSALIDIPTAGTYTFYTSSDDGSQLFIDGTLVVNNDGIHGLIEKSGTITLTAGTHRLIVTYFDKTGVDGISVQYSGAGVNKQLLPQSLLRQNPLFNVAPAVSNPGAQITGINQPASLSISASDLNLDDVLSYSATGLPTGLSINAATGVISGTVTTTGTYRTRVSVSDSNGGLNTVDFNWTVVGNIAVDPIVTTPQSTGTVVSYTANVTGGSSLQYQWNFGDGTATTAASSSPSISHPFATAGTPIVTLMVTGVAVDPITYQFTQPIHNPLSLNRPNISMSIIYEALPGNDRIWNVNPDNDSVSVFDTVSNLKLDQISVGESPSALAISPDGSIWVTNKGSASISVIDPTTLAVTQQISLPRASQPHGIVFSPDDSYAYVALEAAGQVVKLHPTSGAQIGSVAVAQHPRHLSINTDGSVLYVSQFITEAMPGEATANVQTTVLGVKYGGEVSKVDTAMMVVQSDIVLEHSERQDSEHSGRGIPNYLGPMVISPDGLTGWVPSKQDNIKRGMLRDGQPLTHDSTVRSITSRVNLTTGIEDTVARIDHDNGGIASSAVFGRYGIYLYVALEGSREVAVLNALNKAEIARIQVGRAPQGLTISADGSKLYTHNFMDRSISVHDLTEMTNQTQTDFNREAVYQTVSTEILSANILRGKQLFYDAQDARVAREQYVSCSSCHNEGADDGRVWDLTGFGEGLRNTISLEGRGGINHGLLHWTGNFDEVQDFEGQIRDLAGGLGLMSDSDFHAGTRSQPMGDKKQGLSDDLDALAAYVSSLDSFQKSPHQEANGSLTTAATAGKIIFAEQGCASCHSGAKFTDSGPNNLHDIGTLKASSGQRLNGGLTGIDTPTLRGVWSTSPYLHDGSALDLSSAVDAHAGITLTTLQKTELVAYLQQIDGDVDNVTNYSNPVSNTQITLDGNLADWPSNSFLAADPDDTAGTNNPIDWKTAIIAHSDSNLFIGYESYNTIDVSSNTGTDVIWGWQVLIDTDQNAGTGYKQGGIGADYIIEGKHLQRYTGTGTNWSWSSLGNTALAYQGNSLELSIDRALIGDPSTVRVVFRGINQAYDGTQVDLYPNDSNAFFEYQIPGGSDQFNTAPTTENQSLIVSANSTINIILAATDAEDNRLTFEVLSNPQNGTLGGIAPDIIYQPEPGFTGTDSFSFVANDGINESNIGVIDITITNDQGGVIFNELSSDLVLDGSDSDWSTITRFNLDPDDVSGENETINWRSSALAHDAEFLHILYESYNRIDAALDSGDYLPWGWQVYLDTDKDAETGYRVGNIGADYIIEGQAIHRYVGLGSNWNWKNIGVAERQYEGNIAELRLPRSLLGNPDSLRLIFRGFNSSMGGSSIDFYPDNQNDSNNSEQFFKYEFSDGAYLDGRPVANAQALSTNSDSSLSLILDGRDALGSDFTYTIQSNPEHGSLTGTAPNLVYSPDAGYIGFDSFKFVVNNGSQDSTAATISINITNQSNEIVTNNVPNIDIDGLIQDWNGLSAFSDDPDDMPLVDDTINWQNATMAHNDETLYLLYHNRGMINADAPDGSYIPWGWQTYLDTDNDPSTGFKVGDIGADFIIEATSINRYSGTNNSWSWQTVDIAEVSYSNDVAEIAIPLAALDNPANIRLSFKGNNIAVGGSDSDFYPDGADTEGAANNYFSYSLSNALTQVRIRPQTISQTMVLASDTTTAIRLNANDPDSDSLNFVLLRPPAHGTLSVIGEVVSYTPTAGYIGEDSFDYIANDGVFDSSVATVSITLREGGLTSAAETNTGSGTTNDSTDTGVDTATGGGGSIDWSFGLVAMLMLLAGTHRRRFSLKVSK